MATKKSPKMKNLPAGKKAGAVKGGGKKRETSSTNAGTPARDGEYVSNSITKDGPMATKKSPKMKNLPAGKKAGAVKGGAKRCSTRPSSTERRHAGSPDRAPGLAFCPSTDAQCLNRRRSTESMATKRSNDRVSREKSPSKLTLKKSTLKDLAPGARAGRVQGGRLPDTKACPYLGPTK